MVRDFNTTKVEKSFKDEICFLKIDDKPIASARLWRVLL
jgi:hypothetical protein